MSDAADGVVISPVTRGKAPVVGGVLAVFGCTLLLTALRRGYSGFGVAGVVALLAAAPFFFHYGQTIVDFAAGAWTRRRGSLFGVRTTSGPLDQLTRINVRESLDGNGNKRWTVTLVQQAGDDVPWHCYSYQQEEAMKNDVLRLKGTLGLPVSFTDERV